MIFGKGGFAQYISYVTFGSYVALLVTINKPAAQAAGAD